MSVIHFATELSGGAGSFVRNIHVAMQARGLPSFVITRERNDLSDCATVKPLTRVGGSLRARSLTLLGRLGVINTFYAIFGIERSPVGLSEIQHALGSQSPTAFIFYWVSYFVDFATMHKLRQAYPNVPFVFVCLDDALLTGGCHISWGCRGYEGACSNCPAISLAFIKKRVERGFRQREALITAIDPLAIYPTTNMYEMGSKSAVLKNARSAVVPLGAISAREQDAAMKQSLQARSGRNEKKAFLLVRSSSEYRKGCDLFVSALKAMSKRMPDLRERLQVITIGDGALASAQIDKYVDHIDLGFVTRERLLSIYQTVDACMVTSREDSGPLMINECVALGIFVISTPIGVARDLIVEGENGLITHTVSCDAICDSLKVFLMNFQAIGVDLAQSDLRRSSLTFEGYIKALLDTIHA